MQQCPGAVVRIGSEMLGIRQTRRKSKALVEKTGDGGLGVKTGWECDRVVLGISPCWGLQREEQQMPSSE